MSRSLAYLVWQCDGVISLADKIRHAMDQGGARQAARVESEKAMAELWSKTGSRVRKRVGRSKTEGQVGGGGACDGRVFTEEGSEERKKRYS